MYGDIGYKFCWLLPFEDQNHDTSIGNESRAHLSGIPFHYPLRPYTFCLADYFIKGSEHVPRMEGIDHILELVEIQDIQQALG